MITETRSTSGPLLTEGRRPYGASRPRGPSALRLRLSFLRFSRKEVVFFYYPVCRCQRTRHTVDRESTRRRRLHLALRLRFASPAHTDSRSAGSRCLGLPGFPLRTPARSKNGV